MNLTTILILGIGLSMDAFAVSICKGLALRHVTISDRLKAGLWFGCFQGLMPAIGYFFGNLFAGQVQAFSGWIAFALLSLIGGNMIRESFSEQKKENSSMKPAEMFMLALATSIDALAVGISFSMMPVQIAAGWGETANTLLACFLIILETGILSAIGIGLGSKAGSRFEQKATLAGGIVLILIGLHLLFGSPGVF